MLVAAEEEGAQEAVQEEAEEAEEVKNFTLFHDRSFEFSCHSFVTKDVFRFNHFLLFQML